MTPTDTHHTAGAAAPVVPDLSAYLIAGAVSSDHTVFTRDTDGRTPAQGIEDGVIAEQLGFRRVFLSERWDIKEAQVILAAVAARTSRLEVATGLICPTTRHPWQLAAFGATMHACFGPRFTLGLGRGNDSALRRMGLREATYRQMTDYTSIIRRLWDGETVAYDGPVGTFEALALAQTYHGEHPKIWFGTMGNPSGAKLAASSFDGVLLPPIMTPDATRQAVQRLRNACADIGRDPTTLHICQSVVTAPDLDDTETRAIAHARAVTYFQYPGYGEALAKGNGWDPDIVRQVREHRQFATISTHADFTFHRHQMLEPATLIPDEWMAQSCALGSIATCTASLQRFRDAGADEITTYGSTPGQNAHLIQAWHTKSATPAHTTAP